MSAGSAAGRVRGTLALTAWIVLVLLAALPARARAAAWLAPIALSSPQSSTSVSCGFLCTTAYLGATGVDVAVNARGDAIAAWSRRSDGGNQMIVQASFRPAGGTFGNPQDLGTTTAPSGFIFLSGPTMATAIDDQGNAAVVWPSTDNAHTVVDIATKPSGGSFAATQRLTDNTKDVGQDPRVAMNGAGTTVVTWSIPGGPLNKTVIQANTRPLGGSFAPTPDNLSDSAQDARNPRIAINGAGAVVVTWLRQDGTTNCGGGTSSCLIAQAAVRPAGGAFAAPQSLSATGQDANTPDAAIDAQGRATAIWTRYDGANYVTQARALTVPGAIASGVDNVSDPGVDGYAPRVGIDGQNTAVAVWSGNNAIQSASRPSGGSFGSVQTVSAPGSGTLFSNVELDPAGNAVAVWTQFSSVVTIQASRRPAGEAFGAVQDISTTDGSVGFSAPALGIDNQGNALAGWAFTRTSDSKSLTQVAPFDAGPPDVTNIAVPLSANTGQSVGMSAEASDRWSAVSISWDFGDGATASGTSVSHAYGATGNFTVTIKATDSANNTTTITRPVQVTNAPPPANDNGPNRNVRDAVIPRITSGFIHAWSVKGARTAATVLRLTKVPKGATVTMRCTGKRCPFKRRTFKAKKTGTVDLFKLLGRKGRRFRAGNVLEIRITAPGRIGKVISFRFRSGKVPSRRVRCLQPGASKPSAC